MVTIAIFSVAKISRSEIDVTITLKKVVSMVVNLV